MSNGSWCGGFVCAPGVASLFEGVEIVVYKPGLKGLPQSVPAVALNISRPLRLGRSTEWWSQQPSRSCANCLVTGCQLLSQLFPVLLC